MNKKCKLQFVLTLSRSSSLSSRRLQAHERYFTITKGWFFTDLQPCCASCFQHTAESAVVRVHMHVHLMVAALLWDQQDISCFSQTPHSLVLLFCSGIINPSTRSTLTTILCSAQQSDPLTQKLQEHDQAENPRLKNIWHTKFTIKVTGLRGMLH